MPVDSENINQNSKLSLVRKHPQAWRLAIIFVGILALCYAVYLLYVSAGLRVTGILPESGRANTPDTFDIIVFDFSEPIKPDTVVFEVSPSRTIKTIAPPDFPHRLSIMPAVVGWEAGTKYTITVVAAEAQDGT